MRQTAEGEITGRGGQNSRIGEQEQDTCRQRCQDFGRGAGQDMAGVVLTVSAREWLVYDSMQPHRAISFDVPLKKHGI